MRHHWILTGLLGTALSLGACKKEKFRPVGDDDTGETDQEDSGLADADGDGFGSWEGDCDDSDASINPDATELCDGVDNDCDSTIDESDAEDATTWYFDGDDDGYGDPGSDARSCDPIDNHVDNDQDCDDSRESVHPDADEMCDGVDNDCDDQIDEGEPSDTTTWYEDGDGDGYGSDDSTAQACSAPSGFVADGGDCDDEDPAIHPGANDGTNDGVDDNCDGTADDQASCNPYRPFGFPAGSQRTYQTTSYDGVTYTEAVQVTSWDASTGQALLERRFSATGGGGMTVEETHACNGAAVQMTGWVYTDANGLSSTITYSSARTDVEDPSLMTPGDRWSYSYDATEALSSSGWSASGVMEVAGTEAVEVAAGSFDALRIDNSYTIVDNTGSIGGREGVVTTWWVQNLGPVKVEDIATDGTLYESRELQSYTGYSP